MVFVRFRLKNDHSIEVILCREEACNYGIDEEDFDCATPETQTLLSGILQKARKETGALPQKGDFILQIYKQDEDTILSFTLESPTEEEQRQEVCCFRDSENLIVCSQCLYKKFGESLTQSSLFALKGKYYLTFCFPKEKRSAVRGLVLEYASLADHANLAKGTLSERAKCLIENDAVAVLCRYFN